MEYLERSTVDSGLKAIKKSIDEMMISKYALIASGSISEEEVNQVITETIDECVAKYSGKNMHEIAMIMMEKLIAELEEKINGKEI